MSTTIDQAFIKQFEEEVHQAYQRMGSKLRNTVRMKNGVRGSSTVFQKVGKGSAATKARHGKVPVMNVDHTPVGGHPCVGGAADVDQQQHREVAPAIPVCDQAQLAPVHVAQRELNATEGVTQAWTCTGCAVRGKRTAAYRVPLHELCRPAPQARGQRSRRK